MLSFRRAMSKKEKSLRKMPFNTSTRLYSVLAERINVSICSDKRSDAICIKPMLFLSALAQRCFSWQSDFGMAMPVNRTRSITPVMDIVKNAFFTESEPRRFSACHLCCRLSPRIRFRRACRRFPWWSRWTRRCIESTCRGRWRTYPSVLRSDRSRAWLCLLSPWIFFSV